MKLLPTVLTILAVSPLLGSKPDPCRVPDAACLVRLSMDPSGPNLQVGDPTYLTLARRGMAIVPALIDLVDDPTYTDQRVPLFGGNWAVGDIAHSLLSDIAPDIPWLELVTGRSDPENDHAYRSCGYCAYWNYVRESPAHRVELRKSVSAWFARNRERLHWKSDPQRLTGGAFVLDPVTSSAEPVRPVLVVRMGRRDDVVEPDRLFRVLLGEKVLVRDLELGDSLEDAVVELSWGDAPSAAWVVQMQFETSLSIGDEGPHLDLLEWKHFTSEWRDLDRLASTRFHVAALTEEARARFPAYKPAELAVAVRAAGGEEWLERMEQGAQGHVDIGVMRLRVTDPAAPDRPFIVEFLIPMGC